MTWPSVFTYNFASNPSFEQDLSGVIPVNGASTEIDPTTGLYGDQSLVVSTPGQNPSEGVILPPGTVLASGTGCVSFWLQGNDVDSQGTLNVYAIDTTSQVTLGTTTVEFDPTLSWQQVVIQPVSLVSGDTIAVYIETIGIQATAFNIDGVQYEPSLPLNGGTLPTPYIDGDQEYGFWVGTPEESASYKLFQNQISAGGDIYTSGSGSLLQTGAVFYLVNTDPATGPTQVQGNIDLSGDTFLGLTGLQSGGGGVSVSGLTTLLMYAGLNNFAIFTSADVDPAISLVGYNNAGVSSGTNTSGSSGYTRPYATFSAPQVYQTSQGYNLWNTAAYFAVGYEFASVAASGAQNITHVQAELVPGNGTAVVPTSYVRPRALTATLAPTRLNYVPNPSCEVSAAGWTADAPGVTITRVSGGAITGSSWSGQAVTTGANKGMYIACPQLIVGETYTASAYVKVTTTGVSTGKIAVGSASATFPMVLNGWVRMSLTFVAQTSNVLLDIRMSAATTFLVDAVMLEVGGALNAYADGSFPGWNWENTSAGLSRSYYYERGNIAYAAVQNILSSHLPLGLQARAPVYNAPPTQYSA